MADGTRPGSLRAMIASAITLVLAATTLVLAPAPARAVPNTELPYPEFSGSENPVPETGVDYAPGGYLQEVFDADLAAGAGVSPAQDFWIDGMLARYGTAGEAGDNNQWLFSRGRAVFMKSHSPAQLGFGGQVAYWESIDDRSAYTIAVEQGGEPVSVSETTSERKQTPSYWHSTHTAAGLELEQTKFITDGNVAITVLELSNSGGSDIDVTLAASSPYATVAGDDELTGVVDAYNDLTTLFPRLSGDGFAVDGDRLTREITVPAGEAVTTKVQLGFVADEIDASRAEYDHYSALAPWEAYTEHVRAYNQWWAENIPYLDTPEDNIDKVLFYRWWLMRFNFLDANIPGNDYQFPTAMEGVLGYNNAIVLTTGMFIDDLKYFRDPVYSYGPWVGAGEVSRSGKYVDNPGDPANWSNSYTQYISEAAWRAYQLHGGPTAIAGNLARYAEYDVRDLLEDFDEDGNGLIEYDWGAMTGNDADAVSFDWRAGNLDRTESAYLYSNALASAQAYRVAGQPDKAEEMEALADTVKQAVLDHLWDEEENLLKHRHVETDALVPWKEINNYYPFTVGLMPREGEADYDDDYVEALRLFGDADEYPIFPFYTANQADKAEAAAQGHPGSNNFSVINSTVTFRMLSRVLHEYPNEYIDAEWYKKLLYWNAWAHYMNDGDNRLPDQNEFWSDGSADPQNIGYRSWIHHTILGTTNFTMIEDAMGLRPREDGMIELDPIELDWDYFTADNIRYRDRDLTVVWDDVDHYGSAVADGYSVYLDGALAFSVDSLAHVVYDPATGDVQVPDGVTVTSSTAIDVQSPTEVTFDDDDRIVSMMANAGADVATASTGSENLAVGAAVSATYTDDARTPEAAVNGTTINEPFWGSAGSPNTEDTFTVELDGTQTFDDVRLYFYRSSSSATVPGYSAPAMYTVEYRSGGQWHNVPGQAREPAHPQGNYNHIGFEEVTGDAVRVTMTHADGAHTGLKEIQVFSTGIETAPADNAAPLVQVWQDEGTSTPGAAALTGSVRDDALPTGHLESEWTIVDAPEGAFATFADPASASTTLRYSTEGTYVVRLSATDGEETSSVDVTIEGEANSGGGNLAPAATPSAEFTASWNDVNAVNDGVILHSGGAQTSLWGTWSGSHPATRWLQYDWDSPVRVGSTEVSFWSDQADPSSSNGVNVPQSWRAQYWTGDAWVDVPDPDEYGVARNEPNSTSFDPVTTTRMRLILDAAGSDPYAAVGVSEWKVFADAPVSVEPIDVRTAVGELPDMPATADAIFADGSREAMEVTWPAITEDQVAAETSFTVNGLVTGAPQVAEATVWVRATPPGQINQVDAVTVDTLAGVEPDLPGTVGALYNDGSRQDLPVTWDPIDPADYADDGTFTVDGTVESDIAGPKDALANVTVTGGSSGPDTTAPVVSIEPAEEPASGWHTGAVEVTVEASDDRDPEPVVEVSLDGGPWEAYSAPVPVSGEGEHEVRARATDASANVSEAAVLDVAIDSTPPSVSAVADEHLRTVTILATDALSGVELVEYRLDGGAWAEYDGSLLVGPAEVTVEYRASDAAGHGSEIGSIELDEATSYSLNLALDATPSASVTAGWNSVDGLNDDVQPQTSGDVDPNDNANTWGAWPEIGEQWVQYDWDEPVTFERLSAYFVSNLDGDGLGIDVPESWVAEYWDSASQEWTPVPDPSDYGTEVDQYNEVTFTEVTTDRLRLVMQARGTEEGAGSLGIKEWQVWQDSGEPGPDTQAPEVSAEVTPPVPATGWHTGAVTVTAAALDARDDDPMIETRLDGGAWEPYESPVTFTDDGAYQLELRATDEAGNVSEVTLLEIGIDSLAPTASATIDEDERTVRLEAGDATSGVDRIEYREVGGADWTTYSGPIAVDEEELTFEYRAVDVAGHVSPLAEVTMPAADPGGGGDQVTGEEQLHIGRTRAAPGDEVTVELTGGVPGATFVIELRSDPVQLGTLTLGSDGSGTVTVTVPADTAGGEHQLVAVLGETEVSAPIMIVTAAEPGDSDGSGGGGSGSDGGADAGSDGGNGAGSDADLPSTGAGVLGIAGIAFLVLLIGAALIRASSGSRRGEDSLTS
ncbi:OmpL47-type beta-barrel domain-containing protein [Ruania halotolerans]|uniref:OmpL47-type beta-barrel domain-containing protein n=1 Tax=Ruania halotolerans TaxID=2897773 RepID=UPI001E52FC20|nr:Ig-like domain-containing protein [Ruania halotolerans]UFU06859.1 Ig-like domain-containing protein [Ruania halotolerans]